MLVLATLCWGLSFPLVKNWQQAAVNCPGGEILATLSLIAVRMILAVALFALVQPRLFWRPSWREHKIGLVIGLVNFVGLVLQVGALTSTSPALSGFFTSLASAWVPLLALLFLGLRVSGATWLGLSLGIAGAAVLAIDPEHSWALGRGEGITLIASVVFAVAILMIDRLGRTVAPGHLTVSFLAAMGLPALLLTLLGAASGPGLDVWGAWLFAMLSDRSILLDVGLLTLLCTVLAFHWMAVYQPRVEAGRAALVYLLEPVFAAAFSILWGLDDLTLQLLLGGLLILGGNFLVELPLLVRTLLQGTRPTPALSSPVYPAPTSGDLAP
jgi:drug/metabolite transporter (DMT)-like permease